MANFLTQNLGNKSRTFCSLGRFVPWEVLSSGRFFLQAFCPLGHFVLGRFVCAPRILVEDRRSFSVGRIGGHFKRSRNRLRGGGGRRPFEEDRRPF